MAIPALAAGLAVAIAAGGCGGSSDGASTGTSVDIPAITTPDGAVDQGQSDAATSTPVPAGGTSASPTGAKVGADAKGSSPGSGSDRAKANGGGSSKGAKAPIGPSDVEKAKNPGAYGGGSATSNSDQQKAGH